jgi:hypothetical protein
VWRSLTRVGIAREVATPGDKGVACVVARCDGVGSDGAHDRRVAKSGLGRDDAVGNVVVNGLCDKC